MTEQDLARKAKAAEILWQRQKARIYAAIKAITPEDWRREFERLLKKRRVNLPDDF